MDSSLLSTGLSAPLSVPLDGRFFGGDGGAGTPTTSLLYAPGISNNRADGDPINLPLGDIEVEIHASPETWHTGTYALMSIGGQAGLEVQVMDGRLWFGRVAFNLSQADVAIPFATTRIKITHTVSSPYEVVFYTAGDDGVFSQLGAAGSNTQIPAASGARIVFGAETATTALMAGHMSRVIIRDGIGGSDVFDCDFSTFTIGALSGTAVTGEVVTIYQAGINPSAIVDSDAATRYLGALEGAGVTASPVQEEAIRTFIADETAAGRWMAIGRLYFPIWGLEVPNTICMKTLNAEGSFVGLTHEAGYVKGDGAGYFNFRVSPLELGFTINSGMIFCLRVVANSGANNVLLGCANASGTFTTAMTVAAGATYGVINGLPSINSPLVPRGIFTVSRTAADYFETRMRTASGAVQTQTGTSAPTGVSTADMYAFARNENGAITFPADAGQAAYGTSVGLNATETDAFTNNLKTLWETSTGLTLP